MNWIQRQPNRHAGHHDLDAAARLVTALAEWWALRGRLAGQGPLLRELAGRAEPGSDGWCIAQRLLAWTAYDAASLPQALQRCAAIIDVLGDREPSRALVDCLSMQSRILANLGRVPEAAASSHRALAMARELDYPFGQAQAMTGLVIGAFRGGDLDQAVQLARQGMQIPDISGTELRERGYLLAGALAEAGDLAAAEQACAATLAQARDAGDMVFPGDLLRMSWSSWSLRAAPTPTSPDSCTSASEPSARTWTGSGTRPDVADAPTSPGWHWPKA